MSQQLRQRNTIAEKYKWNPADLFTGDEAWEAAIDEAKSQQQELAGYQDELNDGPETLLACLHQLEEAYRLAGKIYTYAAMFYSVDTADQDAAAKNDRAGSLFGQMAAAAAFVEPELITVGFDKIDEWMAQNEELQVYVHYVDTLKRRQKYVRSAEVEQVLGLVNDAFGTAANTHSVLANAELPIKPAVSRDGEEIEIGQGNLGALLTSPDRNLRRTTYENYNDAHLQFKNTMANNLATGIKQDVFFMRARGYSSSLQAALHPNHIPVEVFHNTIDTYKKNIGTWRRYWRVRREALGYDSLYPYDKGAPLTKNKPEVSYEQAVDWVATGLSPLGEEYVEILRRGAVEKRWIDVFPSKGKRAGAFSMGFPGTAPYIMMNFNEDIPGLSTLAHELGHSMHSYYTWANQPMVYSNYGLFLAEVASNVNQALTRDYLLRTHDDPDFQIAIIEEAMGNFHRYFFVMPTLAQFELAIHERVEQGQALTADYLINLLADLWTVGYGDEVVFDREREGVIWASFHTHLYANFYVYQYTTGIAAAHALAQQVLDGEEDAVNRYHNFLKSGGSRYPLETLQAAGVDMASPEPIETAFGVLADYVDRLEMLTQAR